MVRQRNVDVSHEAGASKWPRPGEAHEAAGAAAIDPAGPAQTRLILLVAASSIRSLRVAMSAVISGYCCITVDARHWTGARLLVLTLIPARGADP